ncbi:MAG: transposase, partial [Euzebyaceae bacterium]|nr:transposase [Euzebyaceae bacterium]
MIQALLGYTSEQRFLRYANTHLRGLFPYLPQRPAYNKRLRNAGAMMQHIIGVLARDCPTWHDDLWLVDSTPVECGRSRETVKRSDMAGYASYGYCASHSRFFWGLRLHLIATPSGLPVAYALTSAKTDERDTALAMLHLDPALDGRPGQVLMADKGYLAARHLLPDRWSPGTRPARLASAMIAAGDVVGLLLAMFIAGAPMPLSFLHVAACVLTLAAAGCYRPRFNLGLLHQLPQMLMVLAVPSVAVVFVAAAFDAPRELFVQDALALVLLLSARAISYAAVRFLRRRGRLSEPVAVLGNGSVSEALVSHMREHPEYGLTPIGYLGQERNTDCRAPWLGPNERLDEIIQRHGLRRILVAFSDVREHALVEILRIAAQQGVDIHVVPRFFDVPLRFGSMDEIWGIPLHELPARPL